MIVEAFDRHWRGAPKIRRIVYKPIPEPFTRAAALRNNEVDLIDTVPPNLAGELERVGGHPRAARAQHLDHLSRAQRLQEAALGRARAPGAQLRDRRGRDREERARRQRAPHGRGRSRRRCSASTPPSRATRPDPGAGPAAARGGRLPGRGRDHAGGARGPLPGRQGDRGGARRPVAEGGLQAARCRWRSGAPTSSAISASSSRTPTCSGSAGRCRTATSSTTWSPRRAAASTTRTRRWTRSSTRAAPPWTPRKRRKIYADLARAMVEDATWVFLMQQVDIYATRDRVTWTPRGDQWMLFHEATLK